MTNETNSKVIEGFVELEFLTESEKKKLEVVLNRNEKLNKKEHARLRKLSSTESESTFVEICPEYNLSTRSLNSCHLYRNSVSEIMKENFKKNNTLEINLIGNCISCGRRFSILPWSCASPNGSSCILCKSKMCKKCTHHMDRPNVEICKSCHKNILFEAKSGKWFYNNINKEEPSVDSIRSSSAIGNDRWTSSEKIISFKKEFGSADQLENTGMQTQSSISARSFLPKRKFNNSAYFRIESPNRLNLSPETTENVTSPFRRINKHFKSYYLNTNNYIDATLKSEDSGCALDMDDETASECALKVSTGTIFGSNSKCYFRPLQILNQNTTNNNLITNDSSEYMSFPQMRSDLSFNHHYSMSSNQSKFVGEIMLSLLYDDNTSTVNVTVHKCKNLVSADPEMNCINPYIILFVRPNPLKQSKKKTRTHYSTNSPVFEEYFTINLEIGSHDFNQSLIFLLCHKNDKTGKDLAVGQLILTADDIIHCDQINQWCNFNRMVSSSDHRSVISHQSDISQRYKSSNNILPSPLSDCITFSNNDLVNPDFTIAGELSIAIKYVTFYSNNKPVNELHLWVKSARFTDIESSSNDINEKNTGKTFKSSDNNISSNSKCSAKKSSTNNKWLNDMFGYQNIVAKSHLFTNHGVHSKEISATKYLENESQYIWSSIMKFESDLTELKTSTLEISLWIHSNNAFLNKILPSKCIGSVFLGINNENQKSGTLRDKQYHFKSINENRLWQAMLNKHNIWIDETLVLKNRKEKF